MKQLIVKKIDFRTCYRLLLVEVVAIIVFYIMYGFKLLPRGTLAAVCLILYLFVDIYVGLGYVKYSFIQDEKRFRQIVVAALALSAAASLPATDANPTNYASYGGIVEVAMGGLSTLLFFYAFRLIKNDEMKIFKKLSRLNLYLFISCLCFLVSYYLLRLRLSMLLLPMILAGLIAAGLVWYWKIMLFKHISLKYKQS